MGRLISGNMISAHGAIKNLPVALYEPKWYNGLKTTEREVYGKSQKALKWMSLALQ